MATNVLDLSTTLTADNRPFNQAMDKSAGISGAAFSQIADAAKSYLGVRGLIGVLRNATQQANEFGQNMADLSAITELNIKKIKDSIIDLPNYFGDVNKVANTMYEIVSSGFRNLSEDELVKFQKAVSVSSKVIRADVYQTGNAMTTIANAYQMSLEDVTRMQDWFYLTVREGKAHGDELARTLGLVINNAAESGIALNELGGAISILSRTQSTSQAMIGLNQLINSLIGPTLEAQATARKWGVEIGAAALEAKGFTGILTDLHEKIGGNVEALKGIFGNIRAARAALSLTGGQFKQFINVMKEYDKGYGTGMEAFLKQIDTAQNSFERLSVQADKTLIQIGEDTQKATRFMAELGEAVLAGFSNSFELSRYATYILAINQALVMVRQTLDSLNGAMTRTAAAATATTSAVNAGMAASVTATASKAAIAGMMTGGAAPYGGKLGTMATPKPFFDPMQKASMIDNEATRNLARNLINNRQLGWKAPPGTTKWYEPGAGTINTPPAGIQTGINGYGILRQVGWGATPVNYAQEHAKEVQRLTKLYGKASSEIQKTTAKLPSLYGAMTRQPAGLPTASTELASKAIAPPVAWHTRLGNGIDKTVSGVVKSSAVKVTASAIGVVGKVGLWLGGMFAAANIGWEIGKAIADKFDFKSTSFFQSLQNTTIGGWLAGLVSGDFRRGVDVRGLEESLDDGNRRAIQQSTANRILADKTLTRAVKLELMNSNALVETKDEAIRIQQALNAALKKRAEQLERENHITRQQELIDKRIADSGEELVTARSKATDIGYNLTTQGSDALRKARKELSVADSMKEAKNVMVASGMEHRGRTEDTLPYSIRMRDWLKDKYDVDFDITKWSFQKYYNPESLMKDAQIALAQKLRENTDKGIAEGTLPTELIDKVLKDKSAKPAIDMLHSMLKSGGTIGEVEFTPKEISNMLINLEGKLKGADMSLGAEGTDEQIQDFNENLGSALIKNIKARMDKIYTQVNKTRDDGDKSRELKDAQAELAEAQESITELTSGSSIRLHAEVLKTTSEDIKAVHAEIDTATKALAEANKQYNVLVDEVKSDTSISDAERAKVLDQMKTESNRRQIEAFQNLTALQRKSGQLQQRQEKQRAKLDKVYLETAAEQLEKSLVWLYRWFGGTSIGSLPATALERVKLVIQSAIKDIQDKLKGTTDETQRKIGEMKIEELSKALKKADAGLKSYIDNARKQFDQITSLTKDLDKRGRMSNTDLYHTMLMLAGNMSSFHLGMGGQLDLSSLRNVGRNDGARIRNAQDAQNRIGILMDAHQAEQRHRQAEVATSVKEIRDAMIARQPLFFR